MATIIILKINEVLTKDHTLKLTTYSPTFTNRNIVACFTDILEMFLKLQYDILASLWKA